MNWTLKELAMCRAAKGWGLLLVSLGLLVRIRDTTSFSSVLTFHFAFRISSFILPFFFLSLVFFVPSFCHLRRRTHVAKMASMYLTLALNFSCLPSPSKCCDSKGTNCCVDTRSSSLWLCINSSIFFCFSLFQE